MAFSDMIDGFGYSQMMGQQRFYNEYERRRYEEEMRYRQMMQQPLPGDKPVLKEKPPNPVILLLGNS